MQSDVAITGHLVMGSYREHDTNRPDLQRRGHGYRSGYTRSGNPAALSVSGVRLEGFEPPTF